MVSQPKQQFPVLFVAAIYFYFFQFSFSLSLGGNEAPQVSGSPLAQHTAKDPDEGYQGDFTGFPDGPRNVYAAGSNPRFFNWEAMKPEVECDDAVMIFTASAEGFTNLLVDRKGDSPISVFQLPSSCGYSVRSTWRQMELMVPYDGCYIFQENGSYVLPLQWLGSPVRLSCPVPPHTASPISVSCSHHGMGVKLHGDQTDAQLLGVLVDDVWSPFVSPTCGVPISAQPQELTFFVSHNAPCLSANDPLRLHLVLDDQEFVLSCPVFPPQSLALSQPQLFLPDSPSQKIDYNSFLPQPPAQSLPPQIPDVWYHPHFSHPDVPTEAVQTPASHSPPGICWSPSDPRCSYYTYPPHPHLQTPAKKTRPTPPAPHLHCLEGKMVVFLPFADPGSIQVRDQDRWLFVSAVSPRCEYSIQMTTGPGVVLHAPLPACHSQLRPPSSLSFPIRYWDVSAWQNRTWDLQCSYSPTEAPPPGSTDQNSPSLTEVFCSSQQMTVILPHGPISETAVRDIKGNQVNVLNAPKDCGYNVSEGKDGRLHLSLQLHERCQMSVQGARYVITVLYTTHSGRKEAELSCPAAVPRAGHECSLPPHLRLPCGSGSQAHCVSMGCCYDPPDCFYPMDECTIDRRMVFSVPASLTDPPLSPGLLVAANDSSCRPERATSEYAVFNLPLDDCGTRRVVVGKTVVYMVEIVNMLQAISLNYGTITRDSPVRLLVECRYVPGSLLSVSYVVKTPTLGPEIHSQGVFGVQLRIAKDADYSSFYPQYHQPLHMLVGKPLHLEVRLLNSPDRGLVLLVHFCVAYPRSGKAVWVLLYNGCPNPLDPAPPKTETHSETSSPRSQTRRFTISTFQFLPGEKFRDMDEEIYFMCSTEICSPHDGPCVEGCFGQ